MLFANRGVGDVFMGDTSEEWYTAPGYDPSAYYPAPGYDIVPTMPPAAPATAAQQDAARIYLANQGGIWLEDGIPTGKSFFEKNQTAIYMAAGAFFLFTFLGGHKR